MSEDGKRRKVEKDSEVMREVGGYGDGLLLEIIDQLPHAVTWKDKNHVYLGANRYFIRYFGMGKPENIIGKTPTDLFSDRQQLDLVLETDRQVLKTGKPVLNYERRFRTEDGQEHVTLNSKFPLRDKGGDIIGVLAVGKDVTELNRVEGRMKHRLNIERLVSTISSRFVGLYDIDRAIDATLRDLGRFSKADRAYLFKFRENGTIMDNTHEWCRTSVAPQREKLQNLASVTFPWWVSKILSGEYIHIRDVNMLPDETAAEREILSSQDIKSVLVIGFSIEGKVAGFIGLDNVVGDVEWDEGDLALLRTVSEIVGNALERNLAEEKLRSSVEEKEILLREVHHRVKNNLQVVSSLLDLSMLHSNDPQTQRSLENARSKVNTMALIHTYLYRDSRFDRINIAQCLSTLVEQLSCIYSSSGKIDTLIQSADVLLSINQAIPCALVLNELISNAFKHAFKGRGTGTIEIFISNDGHGEISIELRDDGIGIPDGLELDSADSLGLTLVRNLVRHQLRGEVFMRSKVGTEFSIRFKQSDGVPLGSQ